MAKILFTNREDTPIDRNKINNRGEILEIVDDYSERSMDLLSENFGVPGLDYDLD